MLLGLRSKNKKHAAVHVDYTVHIQEIKPWPAPAPESKKHPRSVVIQWANGDRSSGSTSSVLPSPPGAGDEEGKIEFNESFKIEVKLSKGHGSSGFQKNLLELNLYELRSNKASKGQHLGSAAIDLADHGVLKEAASVAAPVSCKRSFKNAAQPVVYVRIQPFDGNESSSSSVDKDGKESVSALMTEEYAEEAEIASFTDDDISSTSVDLNADLAGHNIKGEQEHENISDVRNGLPNGTTENLKSGTAKEDFEQPISASDLNGCRESDKDVENQVLNRVELKKEEFQERSVEAPSVVDSPGNLSVAPDATVKQASESSVKTLFPSDFNSSASNRRSKLGGRVYSTLTGDRARNIRFSMRPNRARNDHYEEDVKEIVIQKDTQSGGIKLATEAGTDDQERISLSEDKPPIRISRNEISTNKIRDLELRVELLEGELREAAAIEISLYSIISEHGSSAHKVHTPARRLSRLYIHALKHWSKERRANAARSAASGLVLAAKSCGNDVPRLTFWLSNSVMLRAIITQTTKEPEVVKKDAHDTVENGSKMAPTKKYSPLKWEAVRRKKGKLGLTEHFNEWEEAKTFIDALQKIETWIFSRVVESVWWQTFTPHMQSASEGSERKSHMKKIYGRQQIVGDQQQANLSIEIWKKAFKDASERLCPVRAGGHECGCLPMLARLVMEQCVARLDVAMFNAILRESDDGIPTDPMSDPITELKVLPVPSGKSSFGAGAQLKNAIGNWSRKLADLFGMDEEESPQDENSQKDDKVDVAASMKPFYLLNALSDLLMLPKDMLLERTIRKEVCPAFSSTIVKQILDGFLPDEFCPDPIPDDVLEALESEDHLESNEKGIRNIPCSASPMIYSPPSVASVERVIGNIQTPHLKGGSSMVRKSYTSDDELVELDSPLASITDMYSNPIAKLKESSRSHAIRYQLLHEVWRGDN